MLEGHALLNDICFHLTNSHVLEDAVMTPERVIERSLGDPLVKSTCCGLGMTC